MDQFQGDVQAASAQIPTGTDGAPQPASAVVAPVVSADPSAAQQGGVQGTPQPTVDDQIRQIQSLADQRLAQNYQLQQEVSQLRQQFTDVLTKQIQPQQERNPYDPQTQNEQYWDWKLDQQGRRLLSEAEKVYDKKFMSLAQNAYESNWAQQHPGVDIAQVKAFAQSRGIQQLDDAITLMTLPNQFNQARTAGAQGILQQYRQPQQPGAVSVRGTNAAPQVQPQWNYEEKLREVTQDATAFDRWPPELQKAFDTETRVRQRLSRL